MPATKTKVSAAEAFRQTVKVKGLSDEQIIQRVRKISGSKTFDVKHLSWYKSMYAAGKLSKGRKEAASN